jgi:hypothetical protein
MVVMTQLRELKETGPQEDLVMYFLTLRLSVKIERKESH